jgi:fucose 4-O-acetylase-like acetyltransferase
MPIISRNIPRNGMDKINRETSQRINALKAVLTILVVFIHNTYNQITVHDETIVFQIPFFAERIRFLISGIIARTAVPLFFLISGFLLCTKEHDFAIIVKKKCRSILMPYMVWNTLYLLWAILLQNNPFKKTAVLPENNILNWNLSEWAQVFWGKYSPDELIHFPYMGPLWFLRDLFILTLVFLPVKKAVFRFPFCTFGIMALLWLYDIPIYLVSPEALFWFSLGCYIVKYSLNTEILDRIRLPEITVVYFCTILMELLLTAGFAVIHKINIVIGVIFFIKLSKYIIENRKLYSFIEKSGRYLFFVYALHGFVVGYVLRLTCKIAPNLLTNGGGGGTIAILYRFMHHHTDMSVLRDFIE